MTCLVKTLYNPLFALVAKKKQLATIFYTAHCTPPFKCASWTVYRTSAYPQPRYCFLEILFFLWKTTALFLQQYIPLLTILNASIRRRRLWYQFSHNLHVLPIPFLLLLQPCSSTLSPFPSLYLFHSFHISSCKYFPPQPLDTNIFINWNGSRLMHRFSSCSWND